MPTTAERGYGWAHQKERKRWAPKVARGIVTCRRASNGTCLEADPIIRPGTPWDLGDPDTACPAPAAPEHRRCNRATGTHRVTGPPRRQSRDWLAPGG